ncbi:MAG TPA: E2/UBC family protein [Planctomycetota bacterium]|nr:E2/UBC family protein [Planctomycetota bacterium]
MSSNTAVQQQQGQGLKGLVEALSQILPNSPDTLVFVDGIPKVHPGDTATAASVLALVQSVSPATHRVYLENACDPEHSCELGDTPKIIKHGYRFQTVPRDGNLGRGEAIPPVISRDVRELEAAGFKVTVMQSGANFVIVIESVMFPAGLGGKSMAIMLLLPATFNQAAIDNFYIPIETNGASAVFHQRANTIETHGGKTWRRVSWHRSTPWRGAEETLLGYVEWCREGLRRIA